MTRAITYSTVAPIFTGETIVCVASGPSLTRDDVEFCREKARVIVINTSYELAPWADVLYGADLGWWRAHHGAPTFHGLKYALAEKHEFPDVQLLRRVDGVGLAKDPGSLCMGRVAGTRSANSGYQAINLAVHLGAAKIVLLGYDLQRGPTGAHWHPRHAHHPQESPLRDFQQAFPTLVAPLVALNIPIVNCSKVSALTCFPRVPLAQTLEQIAA